MSNSLFSGTDDLICSALHIKRRQHLRRKTQKLASLSEDGAFTLVERLYGRMADNFPGYARHPSDQLWRCSRETHIGERNRSHEKMLEKAVAMLAENGHMPDWFNQCPVATGLTDPSADNKRCVDLVHLSPDTLRLIELKWIGGDTIPFAVFEVVEYGLAYLLARMHKRELGLKAQPFMQDSLSRVRLEIVAPSVFFDGAGHRQLINGLDRALARFAEGKTNGEWSISIGVAAFPDHFYTVPFASGEEVKKSCASRFLTREGRMIRDAFANLSALPIESSNQGLPSTQTL